MSEYTEYGYYDEAKNYAHHYIIPSILKLIKHKEKVCILDIGYGSLTTDLKRNGYDNIYGTDASIPRIKIEKKTAENRFFVQNLNFKELPYEIRSVPFKVIIFTDVIEHLYDPDTFISFCQNIFLKNGEELILSTPYHSYLKNLILSIPNKWDNHPTVFWKGSHIKFWPRKMISRLLNQGFKVTAFKGCRRIPHIWKSMLIKAEIK